MDLDEIVTSLDARKQRATYGAVAGIVGGLARGLMSGRPPSHKYSWVVARRNSRKTGAVRGSPTGYTRAQIHPDCLWQIHNDSDNIIEDTDALIRWLKS